MRYVLALLIIAWGALGLAPTHAGALKVTGQRVADASEVCLANCSSTNASCKRNCPTGFNGSCISACDRQAEFCSQNCQRK